MKTHNRKKSTAIQLRPSKQQLASASEPDDRAIDMAEIDRREDEWAARDSALIAEATAGEGSKIGFSSPRAQRRAVRQVMSSEQVSYGCFSYETKMRGAIDTVKELNPRDGVEGLLAIQMLALHDAGIFFLKKNGFNKNGEFGLKCFSAYRSHMDALDRYRSKNSTINVGVVNVEGGGQAVVGNISTSDKNED